MVNGQYRSGRIFERASHDARRGQHAVMVANVPSPECAFSLRPCPAKSHPRPQEVRRMTGTPTRPLLMLLIGRHHACPSKANKGTGT